ncbi:MAG: diguanylate cyclase [Actinobacteria bacterium 13_1_20CM_2_65_11]|nr:MAG: diguanylate cyclase [Chloroflexi bacterium 13_1_40CM_65_17]OLC63836.1 MAG: diguanylate cyclase [Actinobacteria bacterium 13_1_40CM_4_65_12]OLD24975.1 MAG: diguanylate cyclase [Chloroflexi bacterium 13_1_40CM_3_65_12]OLD50303.1 MAG: diguanylate cyclase [Actinobacteria bacterium 13_1_40CM_2_65_8]OLE78935.1 MAG: diguanylate cyclase [Actinobacteria bacterium 13_1_20CM_2_65_11]
MLAKYLVRRVLATIPVVIGVTLITFMLMHVTAGSYIPGIDLNPNLKAEDVEAIKRYLGLDRPLYIQYITWLAGVGHGDFGRSMIDGSLVSSHIFDRLPATLELTITAILLGILISIPLGVTGALRRGSKIDHALTAMSVGGFAIPAFWLGLLLILVFSVQLQAWGLPFLPSGGVTTPGLGGGDLLDRVVHLILPATVLSFVYLSIWSRFTRSSMLEVLSQDYVRTARAKGMTERRVVYMHALRNAVIPLVTLVGLELPALVSGGLVVEVVFSWPGIGKLLYERALQTDYTTVLGITTFAALLVVAGNLLADILYALLDPRIRYA